MSNRPSHHCAKCGRKFFVDELHLLPEVESYSNTLNQALLHDTEMPTPLDDNFLERKYGFAATSMFCDSCLASLSKSADEECKHS